MGQSKEKIQTFVTDRLPSLMFAITIACAFLFTAPLAFKAIKAFHGNIIDLIWVCAGIVITFNLMILVIYILYKLWKKFYRWLSK